MQKIFQWIAAIAVGLLYFAFLMVPAMWAGGFNISDLPKILLIIGIIGLIGLTFEIVERKKK